MSAGGISMELVPRSNLDLGGTFFPQNLQNNWESWQTVITDQPRFGIDNDKNVEAVKNCRVTVTVRIPNPAGATDLARPLLMCGCCLIVTRLNCDLIPPLVVLCDD